MTLLFISNAKSVMINCIIASGIPTALTQSTVRGCRAKSVTFGKRCSPDGADCSCTGILCNAVEPIAISGKLNNQGALLF